MQLSISNQYRQPLFTFCLFRVDGVEWCKRTPLSTTTRRGYAHLAALGILLAKPSATHPNSSRREHTLSYRLYACDFIIMITWTTLTTTTKGKKEDPIVV